MTSPNSCVCVRETYGNAKKSTPAAMRATHAQMKGSCFAEHFIAATLSVVGGPELTDGEQTPRRRAVALWRKHRLERGDHMQEREHKYGTGHKNRP